MNQKFPLMLAFACLVLGFASCKKDETKPPEKSTIELLTAHTWQIDEIRFLQQNIPYYYKRGGNNNNANFDIEYIKFKTDKTGERSDNNEIYPLTWDFVDGNQNKIRMVVQEKSEVILFWDIIVLKDRVLKYSEYYNRQGTNSLASATRVPKP